MTPAKLLSISFLLVLLGCENKQTRQNSVSKPVRPIVESAKSAALIFTQSKSYTYATNVAAIPVEAIRRITALEKDTLKICDEESGLPINLGDSHAFEDECTSKLHFALVGNSTCLLSYLKGGIGVHTVVYYLTYKGALRHESYSSMVKVENVAQLDSFLQKQLSVSKQPKLAEEDDYTMLTPPPPWPKKPSKEEQP